jgi:hypothetical protein
MTRGGDKAMANSGALSVDNHEFLQDRGGAPLERSPAWELPVTIWKGDAIASAVGDSRNSIQSAHAELASDRWSRPTRTLLILGCASLCWVVPIAFLWAVLF